MTNKQIAEAFAAGKMSGQANSMYISGDAIFSYGPHFPLALRKGNKVLVNRDKYSVTTSKQQTQLFGTLAVKGIELIDSNTNELRSMI